MNENLSPKLISLAAGIITLLGFGYSWCLQNISETYVSNDEVHLEAWMEAHGEQLDDGSIKTLRDAWNYAFNDVSASNKAYRHALRVSNFSIVSAVILFMVLFLINKIPCRT